MYLREIHNIAVGINSFAITTKETKHGIYNTCLCTTNLSFYCRKCRILFHFLSSSRFPIFRPIRDAKAGRREKWESLRKIILFIWVKVSWNPFPTAVRFPAFRHIRAVRGWDLCSPLSVLSMPHVQGLWRFPDNPFKSSRPESMLCLSTLVWRKDRLERNIRD